MEMLWIVKDLIRIDFELEQIYNDKYQETKRK